MKQRLWNKNKNGVLLILILMGGIIISGCSYSSPEHSESQRLAFDSSSADELSSPPDYIHQPDIVIQETGGIDEPNSPPVADCTVIPQSTLQTGMNIYFDAGASGDDDGDTLSYYWDFGDGSPLFGPTHYNPVCHRYFRHGDYRVRLTVFDNAGNAGVTEIILHVTESFQD